MDRYVQEGEKNMYRFTEDQIISLFRNCRWYERHLESLRAQEGVKDLVWYNEVFMTSNHIDEYYDIFAILDIWDQYKEWKDELGKK